MRLSAILLAFFATTLPLHAQTATVHGQVTDETGAVIPGATVTLDGPSGALKTATTGNDGTYAIAGVTPGSYSVHVSAPDLTQAEPSTIALHAGTQSLDLKMKVASVAQQVTVAENAGPSISTDPSSNANATVLTGSDLDALSDDPDDLQSDLQALAGPAAGPDGGEIFVDGFSGGQLPSKDSIREVRVNQNPFSAEFDKLGYGRIEILTKPGTNKLHGQTYLNLGDDYFNSRNPYAQQKAPFHLQQYGGSVGGPLGKHASFFLDTERRAIDNGQVIDAVTLDPTTNAINPYTGTLLSPQHRERISPRIDDQIGEKNTLIVRYGFTRNDVEDQGIGGFNLSSRGYTSLEQDQTVQVTETAVLSPTTINETRFQFYHMVNDQASDSLAPAILVLGSFSGGGAQLGNALDSENYYELQNYTSMVKGTHTWKFGVRARGQTVDNTSPTNFGGTFTFAGGLAPELDPENQEILEGSAPVMIPITSIEQYQRALLGLPGGTPTQFSIAAGNPFLAVDQVDVGAYISDDWRVRPNVTFSMGLRYENQTNIHDNRDFAPRFGFAWAPGSKEMSLHPKFVLRGGYGIFYSRFNLSNTETADRYNGIVQQEYLVDNPSFFPTIPTISQLLAMPGIQSTQTIQEVSSTLRAPYVMQSAVTMERQLPGNTTLAATYMNSHGLHMLRSEEFNDPGPVYLMESSGLFNQNQLIANVNSRLNYNVSLWGYYTLSRAMSNTDGLGTFPAVPGSMVGEYAPAAWDIRNRAFLGGSLNTKWNIRLSPFISVQSGAPYNITVGEDIYGDTLFNARPGIPTDLNKPGLIDTIYGWLDPNPSPGEETLPRNYGRGPGQFSLNARLGKTWGFGPERESPSGVSPVAAGHSSGFHSIFSDTTTTRRYNLTLSVSARNLFNHVNEGPIIGQITSPLFGEANSVAGGFGAFAQTANNRRLELQTRFSF